MDYKLLLDMAVFAGDILMQNGAETYRVEDTVYRILQKSNLKTVQAVSYTHLTLPTRAIV